MTDENGAAPADAPQVVDEPSLEISPADAAASIEGGVELIDVRRDHEFEASHIPGARRVELDQIQAEAANLPQDTAILLYCKTGNRSGMAAEALRDGGFDAHSIAGGIVGWKEAGHELDPADGAIVESGEAAAILEAEGRFPVDKVDPPPDEVV
jgi:rhodanese-related sulfurtransferase